LNPNAYIIFIMKHSENLVARFSETIDAFKTFIADKAKQDTFEKMVALLVESYKNGGRLYIAGNGGSAADAQHMAAEFVCRLGKDRDSIPAEALTTDTSVITSIGNDYGFEKIFSRQLHGKMNKDDVFLAITTSGASPNIIDALKFCHERDFFSMVLTGKDGGKAAQLAGICLVANGGQTSVIQELHLAIEHALCSCVENELYP